VVPGKGVAGTNGFALHGGRTGVKRGRLSRLEVDKEKRGGPIKQKGMQGSWVGAGTLGRA